LNKKKKRITFNLLVEVREMKNNILIYISKDGNIKVDVKMKMIIFG